MAELLRSFSLLHQFTRGRRPTRSTTGDLPDGSSRRTRSRSPCARSCERSILRPGSGAGRGMGRPHWPGRAVHAGVALRRRTDRLHRGADCYHLCLCSVRGVGAPMEARPLQDPLRRRAQRRAATRPALETGGAEQETSSLPGPR
ncbi:hypothetical protein T492DRAFT_925875, partial [Pavlovales sp. CCMP2436]